MSFAQAMRPFAMVDTTPTITIGISVMMTLRKITASSTTMSRMVAAPTIASASPDASWLS